MKYVLFLFFLVLFSGIYVSDAFAIKTISDNATGGDCSTIGTWNSATKTCTLSGDVNDGIVIGSNNITLDGNNYTITGDGDDSIKSACVFADAKIGITVKNFKLTKCAYGIELQDVLDSSFIGNEIYDNWAGGISFTFSDNNIFKNNKIYENGQSGISFRGNGNLFESNEISRNAELYSGKITGSGIHMSTTSSENIFADNEINNHPRGLNFDGVYQKNELRDNHFFENEIALNLGSSEKLVIKNNVIESNEVGITNSMFNGKGGKHIIQGNTISENIEGIKLDSGFNVIFENTIILNSEYGLKLSDVEQHRSDHNNKIYNNNFIDNPRQVMYGEKNFFTVEGIGNYWSDFSPNCVDENLDKICDSPYPFSSGTVGVIDNAVWVEKDGWITNAKEVSITPKQTTEPKAQSSDESQTLGIASFVDPSKDPQSYIDKYNNEPTYKKWFHDNYPEYDTIEQAVGLELTKKIPDWVKNIFGWYAQDQVSEEELLNAIKYLIDEGVLVVE